MKIAISRNIMIKTICKNYLASGVIEQEELEHTKNLLSQYPDKDLVTALLESNMLNPLNLEHHEIMFISKH